MRAPLFLVVALLSVFPLHAAESKTPDEIAATILVRAAAGATLDETSGALARKQFKILHRYSAIGWVEARREDGASPSDAELEELLKEPSVAFVERDQVVRAVASPNDTRWPEQEGMRRLGAERAWDVTQGSPAVVVAVSDTGVALDHPDLRAQLWANPGELPGNGMDDDGNGLVDDVHGWDYSAGDADPSDVQGHGTHVAGIIGAEGDNAEGITGLNWRVRLMAVRFLGDDGSGSTADGVKTVLYAAEQGARVLNMSWGGSGHSRALADALDHAHARGMLAVAAAGNDTTDTDYKPHYPSSYESPTLLSVASSAENGTLSGFSNFGKLSVDLAAPGSSILSTFLAGGYKRLSGTSMAAPMVSGVAALALAADPLLTVTELRNLLLAATNPRDAYSGRLSTGGDLDAGLALELLRQPGLQLWPRRLTLAVGSRFTFSARSAQGGLSYSAEPADRIRIDSRTGEAQALAAGEATVTATTSGGQAVSTERLTLVEPSQNPPGGGCGGTLMRSADQPPLTQAAASLEWLLPFCAALLLPGRRKKAPKRETEVSIKGVRSGASMN
ncbi:MAG: S8 family serine peptidase [Bdellovibrionales bacterium]|nr:S8 family serine peptidase [Bdellovibrionales bacterium]